MGFGILQGRAMARRSLVAALITSRFPSPQSFQLLATRSYSNKLFVGGLSFRTDEEGVRRAFGQHGEVVEVKLITDRETGRPKGFGFVTFQSEAEAETARTKMTGQLLDGRIIRVDKAAASRPPLPSSSYGGGGGFSGSGGGGFGGIMNTSSCPASPSNSPPVSEEWGTIPSNVFNVGQTAAPASPTAPAAAPANSSAFVVDSAKPFDSSSAWQSSPPASSPPSSGQSSTGLGGESTPAPSLPSVQASTAWPSSTPSPSSGQASAAWPSSTPAPSGSTFGSGSMVNNSVGSSCTTPSSSPGPIGTSNTPPASSNSSGANGQASSSPSSGFPNFGAGTANVNSFDSSTFGSASGNMTSGTTTFGGTSTTVASSTTTATTMASTTTTTAATTIGSTTSTATTTVGTEPLPTSSAPSPHPLNSPALTSSGKFDMSNFSFNSSSYRESEPPLPRRRPRPRPRPNMTTTTSDFNSSTASILEMRSPFGSNNQFAETSIPKPKGPEFDFGLLNITAPCPEGFRPQGVFDIYIPDDLPEIPPPEPKPKPEKPTSLMMFPLRQLPALDLPYDTPEADNWSEIGSDPPKYDLSSLFPSMGEIIKKDKELHWDPYDYDEEAKAVLPIEAERIIMESDYDEPFR